MKKLKNFLKENHACRDGFEFAKDLTLEQFLNTCERGDWILWLFALTNKSEEDLRKLVGAAGHCANTVRHLMKDERSLKAVDAAIAFGEGKITKGELERAAADAAYAADSATNAAAYAAAYAAANAAAYAANAAAYAAAADAADAAYAAGDAAAKKNNQKETADICRKLLPLEIWDQSKL